MKPLTFFILFVPVILFLSHSDLIAQHDFSPGYIVTSQKDTVYGLIDDKSSWASLNTCLFKRTISETAISYTADELNSYKLDNGRFFISYRLVDPKFEYKIFFEYLFKGKVQIYRTKKSDKGISFYAKKDSVLIPLDDSENRFKNDYGVEYSTISQRYKGQLNYLMNDVPDMQKQILQIKNHLNTNELIKLSKGYHKLACPNEECVEYSKSTHSLKFVFGIGFIYGFPKLFLSDEVLPSPPAYYKNGGFSKNSYFQVNAPIKINLVNLSRKFSITFNPGLSKVNYSSNADWVMYNITKYNCKTNIDIVSIDIPIGFRYTFNSMAWKVWPYIGMGFKYSKFIKKEAKYEVRIEQGNNVSELNNDDFDFSTFQNSLFINTGFDVPMGSHIISIYGNYEYGDGIHRFKYLDSFLKVSKTNMLSFGCSYYF